MRIRAGYEITYECPQPTPMLLMLNVHASRHQDLETVDVVRTDPPLAVAQYHDIYGNLCSRVVLPAGRTVLSADFVIRDTGEPDPVTRDAIQHAVEDLPDDVIVFLLASRYCETEHLSDLAWRLFGDVPPGWGRAQAIVQYAHERITFGYEHARPTKTAFEAHEERGGVCRDYAHLAITLCRCMNIPARYCTGYLGDIGVPTVGVMDFSAWFEVYLGGRWRVMDARHNKPRIGRILMARGRDATDAAIVTSFGPNTLAGFRVIAEEL
ncbi:MAG TPA: transglutaminase family protein, partial [Phenylobacterium sp.]|nr:transglutaminase family protein [Phenylobacterium sp.]